MIQKHKKLASKTIITSISIFLLIMLYQQLEYTKIKSSLSILLGSDGLILYIPLSILSLISRSERFYILHKEITKNPTKYSRLIILAATSMRNLSMSFIPLRLGELILPSILKFTYPKDKVLDTLQPIWISIIFDLCAMLILGLGMLCLAACCESKSFYLVGIHSSFSAFEFIKYLIIFIIIALLIGLLLNITTLLKKFLKSRYLKNINFKVSKYHINLFKISEEIPTLSTLLSLRILLLSMIIRLSKYLSLACLFFSLAEAAEPSIRNTFFILVGFISAELFSSLPGSGVMGFGGYELTFKLIVNTFLPDIICTLSLITSIHLIGFSVEIISCLIISTLSLILFKLTRGARQA